MEPGPRRTLTAALAALLLTLPAMWPFLANAGYWESHDGLFHLYRLLSLREAWAEGIYYPRLFPDFAFGYGFAVLNFYGPLTYYLALPFGALLGPVGAMKSIFAASYPAAALAAWWFARDLYRDDGPNEAAGLVAAAMFTYVPYHLADVQLRGALAESWALVWWPLLFWAVWRARTIPIALVLAALVLTHNLSVVLVAIPLAIWALLGGRARWRPTWGALVAGGVLAAVGTIFYWLPVLLESRFVLISQDIGSQGFATHLAPLRAWLAPSAEYRYFPEQGVAGEHPLSWAQGALLLVALGGLVAQWRGGRRGVVLFWWGLLVAALYLVTPQSTRLWQVLIFPLGLLQYPWRWMGPVALASAMVVAATFAPSPARPLRPLRVATLVLLPLLAASSLQHLPWVPREVEVARHPAPMWAEDAAAGQVGATWTAEFLPLTVREQRWALARAPESVPDAGRRSPIQVDAFGGDRFVFRAQVEATERGWMTFPRFAYPTMAARLDGTPTRVQPRGELGLAAVEVPAGRHRVELEAFPLANRPWLRLALWLGPLTLLLVLARTAGRWTLIGLPLLLFFWLPLDPPERRVLDGGPVAIGDTLQLVGVQLAGGAVRAGEPLPVTLIWFNRERSAQRASSFVHLTPLEGGPPIAQSDGEPNQGHAPRPRWLEGQLVEDLHLVPIPPELPPGRYALWGGIVIVEGDQISPLPGDSGERRLLGEIEVE